MSGGQRLPMSCKPEPLPALRAALGLRLDFAQQSAGIRPQGWASDDKEPQKDHGPGAPKTQGSGGWVWDISRTSAQREMPGGQGPGLQSASTPCNSNSMWKCPLVPVGLLLSGMEASGHGGGEAAAAQQTSRGLPATLPGPGE